MRKLSRLALALVFVAGCGGVPPATGGDTPDLGNTQPDAGDNDPPIDYTDLPLGDVSGGSVSGGAWGYALECKPVPSLPVLQNPRIVVSLDGLTLHLFDPGSGFSKVFPIGPGAIESSETAAEFNESKSLYPVIKTGKQDFAITPSSIQPCKTWWTDPDTGAKSPVFAGLPFMSWYGGYAIHGPIDNFRAQNGGTLRRGYVSHGCIRMEAADVVEVYARIKGVAKVPVRVQREAERDKSGNRVDLPERWIGAECAVDSDCNFTGGFCKMNKYSQRGFCSARCTSASPYCTDRANLPTTFCVTDPDDSTQGMCVSKMINTNQDCRPLDHFVAKKTGRFTQPATTATVCTPGSRGWVGDHCFAAADCKNGTSCVGATSGKPGICTLSCTQFCPDMPGWPVTFCAAAPSLGNTCLRRCSPIQNSYECPANSTCSLLSRPGSTSTQQYVCVPN